MKKLICIFLLIAILFTGCQTTPVDNPVAESNTPSAVTETPGETVTNTPDEEGTQTPAAENTPGQTENVVPTATPTETSDVTSATSSTTSSTATSAGTATATASATKKPSTTPTKTTKPTATPSATVAPKIKTFSIPISVAGGVETNKTKINFKGYYKNNDEKSGTVIISENITTSFTLTRSGTGWEFSSEYSKYPTTLMSVKQQSTSSSKTDVTVTFKAGTSVSADAISMAQFVYVPKNTVNNGIPTMLINVETYQDYYDLTISNDSSIEDVWYSATYAMVEGNKKTYDTTKEQGSLKIKRRGWSSFDKEKKPYTLKLDDGKALLNMNKNKDWVLVANYSDKSLLRNYFAYNISRKMNTSWASDCDFVDLYLTYGSTSDYLGTYLLVEKIEVAEDKINITEMTEEDTNIGTVTINSPVSKVLAGSFLVELESFDRASKGDMLVTSYNAGDNDDGGKYQMSVKSPDKDLFAPSTRFDPSRDRTWPSTHLATKNTNLADYIRSFFITVDDAIDTDNYATFSKYIDVDSFVDYYILNELAKNVDGNFRLSTYFYKDKGGKLKITVWDFDIAFGNCDYGEDSYGNNCGATSGFYLRTQTSWYKHMFRTQEFCNKVQARWKELRKGILSDSSIESMLSAQGSKLTTAAKANFERWDILGKYVWPNSQEIVRCDTYEENVEQLISWLQRRAAWLDSNI